MGGCKGAVDGCVLSKDKQYERNLEYAVRFSDEVVGSSSHSKRGKIEEGLMIIR